MMLPLFLCVLFDAIEPGPSPGNEIIWQNNAIVTIHWQNDSIQPITWIVG